jgi:phenylpyruvate tautomerase PptA (4-oxalocrotonate tautomerase family)
MPFLDITVFEHSMEQRAVLAEQVTTALTQSWRISADIVTLYFQILREGECAHAGAVVASANARVFIKVHAFPRNTAQKRAAADGMTQACAQVLQIPPKSIAIYFLDREHHDVSHAGVLACDETH